MGILSNFGFVLIHSHMSSLLLRSLDWTNISRVVVSKYHAMDQKLLVMVGKLPDNGRAKQAIISDFKRLYR